MTKHYGYRNGDHPTEKKQRYVANWAEYQYGRILVACGPMISGLEYRKL